MQQHDIQRLTSWFEEYTNGFRDSDPEVDRNIFLKVQHTHAVCAVMSELATGEGLTENEARIAGSVALLHDVGRFPQYRRWRTFRDSVSDNHARLGVEVIRQYALLADVPPEERRLIEEAVRFHNLRELPRRPLLPTDRYLRLIRDADKLDIWRVFLETFQQPVEQRASAALLGLPDRPGVTPACLQALAEQRVVNLSLATCVNDFKLLLISWAYDLSFATSYCLLQQLGHLTTLAGYLPQSEEVQAAVDCAVKHVARRAVLRF